MSEPSDVRDAWGRYASSFAAERADADMRPSMRRLIELAGLEEGSLVLDVATGAGFTAFAFARTGCRVVPSDPTHEMLLATREGWADRALDGAARVVEAWAEALPFRDATFDAVVSHRAPHQFADQRAFAGESARVLRPGGILGIADQSPADGFEDWHNELERMRDPTHEFARSPKEWREIVGGAGFRVDHVDIVYQEHDLKDWLDRVSCPPDRADRVRRMFDEIPEDIRDVYRPADGRFRTPQVVLVARR